MPRNYTPKAKKYSEDDLQNALNDVKSQKLSVRAAARKYNIDKSLLSRRIHNKGVNKRGRRTALAAATENELAEMLKTMGRWGFGLSKKEVADVIQEYVCMNQMDTPFKENKPGREWIMAFLSRNGLSVRKPEPLEQCRRSATSDPFVIYKFYDLLEKTITELDLLDKPHHIYNLDETAVSSDPTRLKIIAEKGQKVHRNIQGSGKENTTVLACVSAAGELLPPLIIHQATYLWSTWRGTNDLPGTVYAVSEKGWMNTQVFQEYFIHFSKTVKQRPLLLILDGHVTHLDPVTLQLAKDGNITILKLPAHTTDILQPLDVSCFRPLKLRWDTQLIEWQRENQRKFTKSEFSNLLCAIWNDAMTPTTIVNGFRGTGLYPPNRDKYPVRRFDPEKLQRYNNCQNATENAQQTTDTNASDEEGPSTSQNFATILLKKIKRTETTCQPRKRLDIEGKLVTSEEFIKAAKDKKTKSKRNCKQPKLKKNVGKKKVKDSSSSEDFAEEWIPSGDSDDDIDWATKDSDTDEYITTGPPMATDLNSKNYQEGDYVLVNFPSSKGKRIFRYVCIVKSVDGELLEVMGMKSTDFQNTTFKANEDDVSEIHSSSVLFKLPNPETLTAGSRIRYLFKNPIDILEK